MPKESEASVGRLTNRKAVIFRCLHYGKKKKVGWFGVSTPLPCLFPFFFFT